MFSVNLYQLGCENNFMNAQEIDYWFLEESHVYCVSPIDA